MNYIDKLINKVNWKLIKLKNKFYKLPIFTDDKSVAYVLGVSNHPNAGDQEITLAQKKFINKYLPEYHYVEIDKEKIKYIIDDLVQILKRNDIVFFQGGGTMSNLYPEHELPRQMVLEKLRTFPGKIIQFPVSFYFENMDEFNKVKNIYNNAKNLKLFVRESKSYKILNSTLDIPVYHVPDIVLSQNEANSHSKRGSNIVVMFRKDKECLLPANLSKKIIDYFSSISPIIITDNYVHKHRPTTEVNREYLLESKFSEFQSAKLIITDRLHGMIFAYITKTPAIVFDNSYGKVKYSYLDWLTNCDYIKFLPADTTNLDDVIDAYNQLTKIDINFSLDVDSAFLPLINEIKH